jgi:hypothetical protein
VTVSDTRATLVCTDNLRTDRCMFLSLLSFTVAPRHSDGGSRLPHSVRLWERNAAATLRSGSICA